MALRRWPGPVSASCLRLPLTNVPCWQCSRKGASLLSQWQRQLRLQSTSTSRQPDKRVAVIGGGITGLTTALHLASQHSTRVVLYEKSNALGGWMQSETVDIDSGKVVFDYGPRTLMGGLPDAMATVELLIKLNMLDSTMRIGTKSPGLANRYIYYPDHLVRLPGPGGGASFFDTLRDMLREPAYEGVLRSLLGEPFKESRDPKVRDESVASFYRRRFGPGIADNLVSALSHGVYAGDTDKLSMKATMRQPWDDEFGPGVIINLMNKTLARKPIYYKHNKIQVVRAIRREYSSEFNTRVGLMFAPGYILYLEGGMHSLITALSRELKKLPNVEIVRNASITHIQYDKAKQSMILSSAVNKPPARYNYVISTTPSTVLADQLRGPGGRTPPTATSRMLAANDYAVSVMVVNLFYKNPDLIPTQGFGYLIPRSVPFEQNPERALGVMFASHAVRGQDSAAGTKLAVMIGGHWWDGWDKSDLPDEQTGIAMAKSVVARHLGIVDEPVVAKARLQYKAIPQYTVGHCDRMEDLHEYLCREYDSRLKVAGAWYTGVAVNDGITAGRAIATALHAGHTDETGLEDYVNPPQPAFAAIL
ncbi:protoporphyrinogen oxidase [Trichophyton interdigitale MR816]|uniref:Protoporphyrinogen oxidase n=1 Tax=Trichophyton interdigitale (strain MR816) TaxID=1215338 RepID=A0A059JAV3_TRIIM|nr:protoporphyrinogen oxidase [Trichophyton interdigitale MR816]